MIGEPTSQADKFSPGTFVWEVTYCDEDVCRIANMLDEALAALEALAERIDVFGGDLSTDIIPLMKAKLAIDNIYTYMGLQGREFNPSTMHLAISMNPKLHCMTQDQQSSAGDLLVTLFHLIHEIYDRDFDGRLRVPGKIPLPADRTMKKLRWVVERFRQLRGSINQQGVDAERKSSLLEPDRTLEPEFEVELTPSERDCLATIREVGHRLTTSAVIQAMNEAGRFHGVSTIKNALSQLRKSKLLTNRSDKTPRGYGLPEWE